MNAANVPCPNCLDLLKACKTLLHQIENGTLVRDISHDAEMDWASSMMRFVRELQEVQLAVYKADALLRKADLSTCSNADLKNWRDSQ